MRVKAPPLLLHVFSTFATGGPQMRFCAIAHHFGPAYRHAIIALDGNTACRARLAPTLDVLFPETPLRKGETLGNLRRIRAVLRQVRPDLLITSNWGSIEWAMANAVFPLVPHLHMEDGFGPEERTRQIPRRVWLRRWSLRRSTVMLPSRTLWRIATEIWRLDPRRLRYIPNGIALARFATPPGTPPPWAGRGLVVGTVAALRAEKNIARLLDAFRRLDENASLVIIGDGPERAALEARARTLGLAARVHFTGHVADPAPLYRFFDVFALSSDTEQMPLSVLEAMAAGCAVAACDVGDVRLMLAPANQEFITPCDDEALGRALAGLLADRARRMVIGAANRAKAEAEYDENVMFCAYADLFAELGAARHEGTGRSRLF